MVWFVIYLVRFYLCVMQAADISSILQQKQIVLFCNCFYLQHYTAVCSPGCLSVPSPVSLFICLFCFHLIVFLKDLFFAYFLNVFSFVFTKSSLSFPLHCMISWQLSLSLSLCVHVCVCARALARSCCQAAVLID